MVPNGVDAALAERPATARRRQLVYPGAVTYSANLDAVAFFAREVMPLLRTSHPDLDLLVTGSTAGADTAALEDRPGLRFTGFVDDIHALVEESAVCVVPLREG